MPELIEAEQPSKSKKFRWVDDYGRHLTAGGILPYDDDGVWVIGEQDKHGITYTDVGGKYQFEDGDIFKTIARELGEETYHLCDLSRTEIVGLYKKNSHKTVYVNGHQNKPVYMCVVVPRSELNGCLDNDKFVEERARVVTRNPDVPPEYYNSVCIRHLTWDDINSGEFKLSYRLKRILRYGPFLEYVGYDILLSPPPTPPPSILAE